tara:strand:+ start:4968 stop:5666 length:699 start_codon:yes stop_codon:yes gene_type:complete
MKSQSQLKQDLKVLKFYNNKNYGYFVEIGSSDGICLSNTYLLEKEFGWGGICVEALPSKFEDLKNNRPNAICINKPIYSESNIEVNFDIAHVCDLLSGISLNIDKHKTQVDKDKTTIKLTTLSLNDLLENCNAPKFIEYLSLDTEGSEFEILKTLNFDKYKFGYIDLEHNFVEPRRSNIKQLLENNGYKYLGQNQFDDTYTFIHTNNCDCEFCYEESEIDKKWKKNLNYKLN